MTEVKADYIVERQIYPGEFVNLTKPGTDNHSVLLFLLDMKWHNACQYMQRLDHQGFIVRNFAFRSRISDIGKLLIKHNLPWKIDSRKMTGSSIYEYRLVSTDFAIKEQLLIKEET